MSNDTQITSGTCSELPEDSVRPPRGYLSEAISQVLAELAKVFEAVIRENDKRMAPLREFALNMMEAHRLAENVHERVLECLLSRGWCHSYHFTAANIIHLGELVRIGKGDEIDLGMAEFTRHHFVRILSTACEKYPTRAQILTDAFDAHRAGKYSLSIPTILAQLDGIGCEVLGVARQFFKHKTREKALSRCLETFKLVGSDSPYPVGGIQERMLSALKREWNVALDTNERRDTGQCSPLNRHGVLHGLDTEYPSEHNSLRCINLLGYLLEVRQALREDMPEHLNYINGLLEEIDES